ncbi:cbb3-type cytochrome oxidase subunit 3 [Qipengyuania oceanensis]|uniref:CcoQ/FixQ family Cbb3-type cytochrome c oxidase assembly chaperone n=1 Tax=Qipengyuania oceanensis TaxID=1463597 RepID=A0A844YF00_9SPHN|nr:cbb3-type cytochrome c oxidase subunit 3 [Qipengyuania oceanensis]MXO63716.1 CcoQ/FixQ family Cbb3-type cytochrome c oxidase assembly chaperone [Qipengyuania oceanensis]
MYDFLREFSVSYGLVAMMIVFVALCLWPFRPGAQKHNHKAAQSIFEDEAHGE